MAELRVGKVLAFALANKAELISAFTVGLLAFYLDLARSNPLGDIPGPFLARFTKLWLAKQYCAGHYEQTNITLHEKYGRPDLPWGHANWPNLFNILDPRTHGRDQQRIAKPYAMSSLVGYEAHVDDCTNIFKA
ncbi:unnamed protein product [Clonostachys rhizophaga]|uniref:Uncharacterized protein n=1 Tax=Clonostachys rhizophaga TaxID=160324 RepID=A0A9N9V238_9HYPO|nr:unnamed protein product [Clonostachys rhizophaga]